MAFYDNLGFLSHPFVKTNADEESNLQDYFIPPPFFDAVIGDHINPTPCIVLAPRGSGKTAQRIMVEEWAKIISSSAIDKGTVEYSQQIATELYGEGVVRDLQHVGRELFTINYLANDIFKMSHENTSRNKVAAWENSAVVKQIGSVYLERVKRPVNFYYVIDPAIIRLLYRSYDFEKFFKDRWMECINCKSDNLMDVSLFPEGNDPVCYYCNKNLF